MRILGLLAALALSGCASYNQLLISPDGTVANCDAAGQGLIGMSFAQSAVDGCVASRKAAGFMEIEKAGAVGAVANAECVVMRLVSGGPAEAAGMKVGDLIEAINGVAVKSDKEIHTMLFGPPETKLVFKVKRADAEQEIAVVSKPWKDVNGVK